MTWDWVYTDWGRDSDTIRAINKHTDTANATPKQSTRPNPSVFRRPHKWTGELSL